MGPSCTIEPSARLRLAREGCGRAGPRGDVAGRHRRGSGRRAGAAAPAGDHARSQASRS